MNMPFNRSKNFFWKSPAGENSCGKFRKQCVETRADAVVPAVQNRQEFQRDRQSQLRVLDPQRRRFNLAAPIATRPLVRRSIEVGSGIGPNTYVVRANSKNGCPCESRKRVNSILATPLPVNSVVKTGVCHN